MAAIPRLNNVIRALEQGEVAINTVVSPQTVDRRHRPPGSPV